MSLFQVSLTVKCKKTSQSPLIVIKCFSLSNLTNCGPVAKKDSCFFHVSCVFSKSWTTMATSVRNTYHTTSLKSHCVISVFYDFHLYFLSLLKNPYSFQSTDLPPHTQLYPSTWSSSSGSSGGGSGQWSTKAHLLSGEHVSVCVRVSACALPRR